MLDYNSAIAYNTELAEFYLARAKCNDALGNKERAEKDRDSASRVKKRSAIEKL